MVRVDSNVVMAVRSTTTGFRRRRSSLWRRPVLRLQFREVQTLQWVMRLMTTPMKMHLQVNKLRRILRASFKLARTVERPSRLSGDEMRRATLSAMPVVCIFRDVLR
jgi:hypothetical protein